MRSAPTAALLIRPPVHACRRTDGYGQYSLENERGRPCKRAGALASRRARRQPGANRPAKVAHSTLPAPLRRECRWLLIGRPQLGRPGKPRSRWTAKRSEEHTSELQSLMRISYAVFCLKKQKKTKNTQQHERETKNT